MVLLMHCRRHRYAVQLVALMLIGCGSAPKAPAPDASVPAKPATQAKPPAGLPALPPAGSGRGGYYLDDGPGDNPPEGLLDTPDAEPRIEPYLPRANRPYTVFGKTYTPVTEERPFRQRGIGSWYGKKFHGQKTSSGELYDMYKMTAAHPTLPIPSYVRVTNLFNGKQVIVRVNDRGPFHSARIIDLSYTAALKLGYLGKGSGELEVERLLAQDIALMAKGGKVQQARSEPASVVTAAVNLGATETVQMLDTQAPMVVPAPPAASAQGFYLQLGAYAQAVNADAARARLAQHPAAASAPMEVVEYEKLFRVYSGPFATRAEAAAAALRLQEGGLAKPMIVQR
jgi:rare lipoprotein A